jgi:DNA-binding CsgD family transcriptional regulator
VWENSDGYTAEEMEIFAAFIHENPLVEALIIQRLAGALKITDLVTPNEFERTTLYNEFYRPAGVRNQLVTPMVISDDLMITCSINIGDKDFSDRDKTMLNTIAPHLTNAIRNAFAYQRLNSVLEIEARGIVALGANEKPLFISESARLLLESYFADEKFPADALPGDLASWVKQSGALIAQSEFVSPVAPFRVANQKGELIVRFLYNAETREKTLLLEEKEFHSPRSFANLGLTKRETEILFLITQGKTDDVIATLCNISLRTVHKHVENIYTKLGVETRTGAMLAALKLL